ncbi:hypothetical protein BV898_11297 [Hypsibius exemplaris]|uniref:Uncharacterized protein n=1 Tax=Hypsibius exemplaris TaxID=2072580 RepID=A0A1W0WGX7_HYPEX|nr:hypothetical protein BV898_11297 [Hypsibius exemplaris]
MARLRPFPPPGDAFARRRRRRGSNHFVRLNPRGAYKLPQEPIRHIRLQQIMSNIGTAKHKQNLQTAKSLPGITEVTGNGQSESGRSNYYTVRGISKAAVADAVRTIELRVISVTVRFPGNFFQGSPEDRQLTLRQQKWPTNASSVPTFPPTPPFFSAGIKPSANRVLSRYFKGRENVRPAGDASLPF